MTVDVDAGPTHAASDDAGRRWYLHPFKQTPDGEPERFLSVTTALEGVAKDGIPYWAAKGAAALAMDSLPRMLKMARTDPCGRTGRERCGQCIECEIRYVAEWHRRESERAKDRGTKIHHAVRMWIKHGTQVALDRELQPFFDSWLAFVADYGLKPASWEMAEVTVLNRAHEYAGTLDGALWLNPSATWQATQLYARITGRVAGPPILLLDDLKVRDNEEAAFYQDHALQLSGYRWSPIVLLDNGQEEPMPDVEGAVIIQVRPNGYAVRPVDTSEATFEAFLNYMRGYRWTIEAGDRSVGVRSFPLLDEVAGTKAASERVMRARKQAALEAAAARGEIVAGTGRPPARKRAARKTAPAPVATVAPAGDAKPAKVASLDARRRRAATAHDLFPPMNQRRGDTLRDEDIPF